MIQTLNSAQMLERWRLLVAGEPLRLDCTVERTYGVDMTEIYKEQMRRWYLRLLDSGPEEAFRPEEIAAQASIVRQNGLATVTAPESVRRILRVQFSEWSAALSPDATEEMVRRCAANPFWRRPLAARTGPRTLVVAGARGILSSLICADDPGPALYVFDDSVLLNNNLNDLR